MTLPAIVAAEAIKGSSSDEGKKPGIVQYFSGGGGGSTVITLLVVAGLGVGAWWLWRKLFGKNQAPWVPVLTSTVDSPALESTPALSAGWMPVLTSLVDSPTLLAAVISAGWMPVLSVLVNSPTLIASVISAGWTPVLTALVNGLLTAPAPTGTVQGVVYNRNNPSQVIAGAHISLEGTNYEAYSDQTGFFSIPNVPPGTYVAWCSATGFTQISKTITVYSGQTASIAFDMPPIGTALGFYMGVDFDPSNYPTAKYWYADLNGGVIWTWADIQLNPDALWDESDVDMTDPDFASQALTSELYDANYNLLSRRIVPLGGAAGPKIVNGHAYSFNQDQAHLYDMGPF